MTRADFVIREEQPGDAAALARLSARAFGPGRFARTAYRVREAAGMRGSTGKLDLCAWRGERLVGSIRFSEIAIGGASGALLLGPLAIDPDHVGRGCGRGLIEEGLGRAQAAGYALVVLVGDLTYYRKFGFDLCPAGRMELPGPVDPVRILVKELRPGALDGFHGAVRALPS